MLLCTFDTFVLDDILQHPEYAAWCLEIEHAHNYIPLLETLLVILELQEYLKKNFQR